MTEPMQNLVSLTDALYQADLARLRAIAAEDSSLRADLAALQRDASRSAALPDDDALALRQLGGDLLWQAWVGRKRADLNMRIANVMARKLNAQQALRRSFGKAQVAQQIASKTRTKQRADRASRVQAEQQALAILRKGRSGAR